MDQSKKSLKVEFIYTTVANYALQQNRIPIVRRLVLENISGEDLFDLDILISANIGFANSWSHHIESLPMEKSIEIEVKGLNLISSFLSELTEKLAGELNLRVLIQEKELFNEVYNVDVLAFDYWNGLRAFPEILAAFITPNHPEISKILQAAAIILEKWTGNPSFDGYQSMSTDRVKKQLGAIYEAIANLGLVYCTPPASFENEGQRIRTCDTMFSQKLATCLDISILYASTVEAIGLHPLLIVINGHAFVGAWLVNDMFADSVNYDVSLLKKRTATGINEIALIEATCMNAGNKKTFDEAINEANYKLVKEEEFHLFIDIKRSRYSGIKPLPQRIKTINGWEIVEQNEISDKESVLPENILEVADSSNLAHSQITKQKLWERKLLDLSLRNNLLNLRITQSTIQLLSISLHNFEDALADGDEFQVLAKPEELTNTLIKSGVYQQMNLSDPIADLIKFDISHKRLRTYLTESELKLGLTKLYRASRLSIEENGANTLYLALGFLKWYETPQSELARYSPILLLPIEIIRKSAQLGYVIRSREEDTIMNITLLEMLKQDFGIIIKGLDELPRDDSGVDVVKIFKIIRRGIMSQPRWDLEEHAFIGIFSFSKFIMWNDLNKNAEKLKENKIVASLISGKMEWEEDEFESDVELDIKYHSSKIALPISADSTQLEAICAATENKSFILHGPPGTGKSQTITNIIANALYNGKKVLFVAEKMAALSVVQKRLADIGLDPFCLELHSNKAKKSTTLEHLRKITEMVKKNSPLDFSAESERIHKLKLELNEYVKAVHKKYPFGFSLFDSFTGYAELNNAQSNIQFDVKFIVSMSKDKFIEYCDLVEELQNAGTLCGHPYNHPLKEITTIVYTQQVKSRATDLITNYLGILDERISIEKKIKELLTINNFLLSKEKSSILIELLELILSLPDTPSNLINIEYPERNLGNITKLSRHGISRDEYRNELLNVFTKDFLNYDGVSKLAEWKTLSLKWFLPKYLGQRKILKSLQVHSEGSKIEKEAVVTILENLIKYQTEHSLVISSPFSKELDFLWNNGNSDWNVVILICEKIQQIHHKLTLLTEDVTKVKEIKILLSKLMAEGIKTFKESKGKILSDYLVAVEKQNETENSLKEILNIDFSYDFNGSMDITEVWKNKANIWFQNIEALKNWISWKVVSHKVCSSELSSVVDSYESGSLGNDEVLTSFKKSIYKHCAEYIIANEPALIGFNGKLFEGKIKKFKEQNKYFEGLTKDELFAKLAAQIPLFTREASSNSEIGILQRAMRNGGRAMSLRKLFDSIPNLLPRMCPCMLMSPISVAQYFDVDKSKFDLVIFDEASQMPTSEAVGAIARGENVIVVGDPKQMPPTSFFSTNQFDEENADKEDLESILDDCLALSMPSKHLLWHYRSKHESLIAFSNSNFYENKLLTFPSIDDISTKVTNVFVPGHYDRGKSRQNIFEAKAIVEEVMKRLADPTLSKRSIGIVTFSSVQQNLIEDLLNEEFKNAPELEKIALEAFEPIFIKNLENVQGDERDVILFSVGYGPDKDGKIYMNFGPLVQKGGWRRLNVAVSRARYEMKVFSTLRSAQIDISRSSSDQLAVFKSFLEYTEKGKRSLHHKNYINNSIPKYFEKRVAEEIEKIGYTVHTDIGCSGFRIDIGIVHPEKSSEYILGILTDGENYFASKTAKDREIVQTSVLKMLGWNIFKLWSPDWWDNQQGVLLDIIEAINEVLVNKKRTEEEACTSTNEQDDNPKLELAKLQSVMYQPKETPITQNYLVYNSYELEKHSLINSDEFYLPQFKPTIISQIQRVMDAEAPISHELLSRKILTAWGITRLGVRLNEYLTQIYRQMKLKKTRQGGDNFYWRIDQDPENYHQFRVSSDNSQKRNVEDIAREEITNGIKEVLKNQISLPKEDLIKETSKLFGYSRIGGNVEDMMKLGIDYAVKRNIIENQSGRFVLKSK